MNRLNALCIVREDWMDEEFYSDVVDTYGIEATQGDSPELKRKVIWLSRHDEQIFYLAQGDMEILYGLRLWYDDGTQEIRINEINYKQYNPLEFYTDRIGKYDIQEEI